MNSIARIKIHHAGWMEILEKSVQAHFPKDLYQSEFDWQAEGKKAEVVCQWDPERALNGKLLGRQAIQLGLKASILPKYVNEFILGIEDVTTLAHEIGQIAKARSTNFPAVPLEIEYPISDALFRHLGCTK